MGFFNKLGRKVESFKLTAEDAADEGEAYRCTACDERFEGEHEECLECGGDLVAVTN